MKSLRRKQSERKEKKKQQQCRTEKGQCQGCMENEKRGSRGKPANAHRC
jgi:hypothetical protein